MTDLPPAPGAPRRRKKSLEPKPKPARPIWYRYLLWALMVGFTIAAAVELRAQYYRNHNLRIAHEALERAEGQKVTYDEIKDRFSGTPQKSTGQNDFVDNVIYTWSWQGLRKYVVRVYVSPTDGRLRAVKSEP